MAKLILQSFFLVLFSMTIVAHQCSAQDDQFSKVLTVSEEIGSGISLKEKTQYKILNYVSNADFDSAQFMQRINGSVFLRVWSTDGEFYDKGISQYQYRSLLQEIGTDVDAQRPTGTKQPINQIDVYSTALRSQLPKLELSFQTLGGKEYMVVKTKSGYEVDKLKLTTKFKKEEWELLSNDLDHLVKNNPLTCSIVSVGKGYTIKGTLFEVGDSNLVIARPLGPNSFNIYGSILAMDVPIQEVTQLAISKNVVKTIIIGGAVGALAGVLSSWIGGSEYWPLGILGGVPGGVIGLAVGVGAGASFRLDGSQQKFEKDQEKIKEWSLMR